MKKFLLKVGVMALCISCSSLANNDCIVIGFHEPGTHTYDGPTFCEQVSFKNIIVRGPLESDGSNIGGLTDVSGPIKSNKAVFSNISVHDTLTSQKVQLLNHSVVKQNIVFLGQEGIVKIDSTSRVYGKVINGIIEK